MTATISTSPIVQYFDNSGNPAAGGTVEIFEAGTTTHAVTWQDRNQTIANANPLTLNSRGECTLWLEPGKLYDYLVKDILGVEIANPQDVSGATSATVTPSPWIITGLTPTFVNARTFTLIGNQTAAFHVNRRVRAQVTAGTRYATIIGSTFGSITTITLGFQNTSDALDAGLSAVDISTETYINPSIHQGNGSLIDLTGYTGADVQLGIGQTAKYSFSAVTSLLLRIATGDQQEYRINVRPNYAAQSANIGSSTLQPNNANTDPSAVNRQVIAGIGATPSASNTNENNFVIDGGTTIRRITVTCCTATLGKTVEATARSHSTTAATMYVAEMDWNDTTTAWTSLGRLNFASALTGFAYVTRII